MATAINVTPMMTRRRLPPSTTAETPIPDHAMDEGSVFGRRGFTLLEILVAVMMLSFVFTTLFVSYRQLVSGANTVANKNMLVEMAGVALHHVVADLNAAFVLQPPFYAPPEVLDTEPSIYRFLGKQSFTGGTAFSEMRWVTSRHIDLRGTGNEGLAAVTYYVEGDDDTGYRLRRSDRLVHFAETDPLDAWPDPIVCEHVEQFDVTFVDAEETTSEDWDSESERFDFSTPTVVVIELGVTGPDGDAIKLSTAVRLTVRRLEPGADEE
jgi:prepilin-type N-terminal cleavage/methylation domain-containing protein